MKDFHITGFIQNTTGMWLDPAAMGNTPSALPLRLVPPAQLGFRNRNRQTLAVERNLLQLDFNYDATEKDHFYARFWGVYEPSYPWDQVMSQQACGPPGKMKICPPNALGGHSMNPDYYNRYEFREAWWKHTQGPFTLFLGRQIVTWGESLAFRVGDVVNPQDLSWNFGFANLEQSRMALWMLHPIIAFPNFGPFTDNYFEGVFAPAFQPTYYGSTSVQEGGFGPGQDSVAGAVSRLPLEGGLVSGSRYFGNQYPNIFPLPPPLTVLPGLPATFPQLHPEFRENHPLVDFEMPLDTWANSQEGFRLHSIIANTEMTAIYWHGHQQLPSAEIVGSVPCGPTTFPVPGKPGGFCVDIFHAAGVNLIYPQLNDIGITANRPLVLPGAWASMLPLVIRGEMLWQDRTPYNTLDPHVLSSIQYSSTLYSLLALDVVQAYVPEISQTGSILANFEWFNQMIMSPSKNMDYAGGFLSPEHWRHNESFLLAAVQEGWWWYAFQPQFIVLYSPDGNTWAFFPHIVLTPPWTNKYFANIVYVGVLGNDRFMAAPIPLGEFKGRSQLLLQLQYNFDFL